MDKIICVGKNYLDHALAMGEPQPPKPVIFLKPPSVLQQASAWHQCVKATYPEGRGEVHPEVEIMLRLGRGGYQLDEAAAYDAIDAVSLGLDMTLRTQQAQLKKQGHPWTLGKVFIDAAISGPWIARDDFRDYLQTPFSLRINDHLVQEGCGQHMLYDPTALVMYISQHFPLCAGDIIYTGTPAGLCAIAPADMATLSWGAYQYQVMWS